jgi:hypothetical protein
MKKTSTLILSIFIYLGVYSQDLKTYSGNMQDAILDQGKATYTYYEKDGQIIRHGKFSYMWSDKDSKSPRGKAYSYSLIKTISGDFKDGLKHGKWTYVINFIDYPLGHSMLGVNGDIFSTGSINMTANYVNGEANGTWTYLENYKDRYMSPTYNSWNWSAFGAPESHSIIVNLKNGDVVGKMTRKDSFTKIYIDLNFDENGFIDGVGTINEKGNKMTYTTKNGLLIKEVHSNMSTASSKIVVDNINLMSDQNAEYSQTKFSLLENRYGHIAQTLSYFEQNKFFNYNKPFGNEPLIGGDKILSEGFGGAIMIKIEPCKQFENSYCGDYQSSYEKAEKYIRYGEDLNAIEQYEECIKCLNAEWSGLCSDEKKNFIKEIDQKIGKLKDKMQKLIEEKQAKENLVSLSNRTELLNAANPVFLYLIRNADRKNVFLIDLLKTVNLIEGRPYADSRNTYKIQDVLSFNEGAQVPSYKNSQGVQQYKQESLIKTKLRYLNGLVSNLDNYPSFLNDSKGFYRNLFQGFLVVDFAYLLEFSKMNSKYEELFAKNLSFEQMNSETNSLNKNWLSDLEKINNYYLKAKASNILERFEYKAEDKSFSFSGIRNNYSNIFEIIDQKISEFNDLDIQSKIVFLKEFEPLLDKLIELDLRSINKELSKMKQTTTNEKYDFIKNK